MPDPVGHQNWPVVTNTGASQPKQVLLYTTRYGDSLSIIARRFLKNPNRWPEIYELNKDQIAHPDRLERGIQLRIPVDTPQVPVKPAPVPPPVATAPAIPPDQVFIQTYTVKRGDSLSAIAVRLWNDEDRWLDLYQENADQIADADAIQPGMVLKVPDAEESKKLREASLDKVTARKPLPREIEMLARAIMAEARGESLPAQKAVAAAIVNYATQNGVSIPRLVRSSHLSSNFDHNQKFYTLPIARMDPAAWQTAVAAAEDAFSPESEGRKLIDDRDHFYDDSIRRPYWGRKGTEVKVDSLYFLKSR